MHMGPSEVAHVYLFMRIAVSYYTIYFKMGHSVKLFLKLNLCSTLNASSRML